MKLSTHADLTRWIDELPSPLAVPLERVRATQLRLRPPQGRTPENEQAALLAGIDAFTAALKFMSYVCIADILGKVHQRDPFVRNRPRLESIYAAISEVLKPRRSYGHWVACLKTIVQAYDQAPELFFIPEFMFARKKMKEDPLTFQEKLNDLLQQRNCFAPGETLNLKRSALQERWSQIDEILGQLYTQLACLCSYDLIIFYDQPEQQDHGWYRAANVYQLKGPNIGTESSLMLPSGTRLRSPVQRPEMEKLYLLSPSHERSLNLHPFILFQLQGELVGQPPVSTFLFNELTDKDLIYHGHSPDTRFAYTIDQIDTEEDSIAGPLYSYFTGLRVALGSMNREDLERLPGWGMRSNILSFQRTIRFHAEAFIGRQQYIEKIDTAVASMSFKCAWVRGNAGYGKTAFLSRMAAINQEYIPYFISSEKETANAATFLAHLCQSMINLFNFPDHITDAHWNNLQKFADLFRDLLRRSGEMLSGAQRLVFLIDALDESERYATEEAQKITRFLPHSREEIPDGVFLLISSRPEMDMGSLADVIIDLEPFTEKEIITILQRHGWGRDEASAAFQKTGGSPLYFRFLLDGVRCGEFTSDRVDELPTGIQHYYQHVWNRWSQLGQQKKRHPETAALALLQQDILGLLAAARSPLGAKELTILLTRLGHPADTITVRHKALAKENAGKYVLGTNQFSLFHDTLREFVLDRTRPKTEEALFGGGLRYHKVLADEDWLPDVTGRDYTRQFMTYHLLHSRQYLRLLDLVLDIDEEGLFRTRLTEEDGVTLLLNDLAHAMKAAKVLGDSTKLFCLSFLRIILRRLGAALVSPEAVRVLFTINQTEQVERMLIAAPDNHMRLQIVAAACAASLEAGQDSAVQRWTLEFQDMAVSLRPRFNSVDFFEELLKHLRHPTVDILVRAVALFPDLDRDFKIHVLGKGITDPERFVAVLNRLKLLFEDINRSEQDIWSEHNLWQTAAKLLSMKSRDEVLPFITQLPAIDTKDWLLLGLFLRECPSETILGKIQLSRRHFSAPEDWADLQDLLFLLRLLESELSFEQIDKWLLDQPKYLGQLETCRRAAEVDAAWLAQAEQQLLLDGLMAPPIVNLACLAFLALASGNKQSAWHAMLTAAIEKILSAGAAFHGFDEMDLEDHIKTLLPAVAEILHQVGDLFPDRQSAFWFGLAAASPALETMTSPEIQNWLTQRLRQTRTSEMGEAHIRFLDSLSTRIIEDIHTIDNRGDIQKIVLPLLVPFAPDPQVIHQIDSLCPVNEYYKTTETLTVLRPGLSLYSLGTIYLHMIDEDGNHINLDELLEPLLVMHLLRGPEKALEFWEDFRQFHAECKNTHPSSESNPPNTYDTVPVNLSAHLLQITGHQESAWQIIRGHDSPFKATEYWGLFPYLSKNLVPQFIDWLVTGNQNFSDVDIVKNVLQAVDPDQRKAGLGILLESPSVGRRLKTTLIEPALRNDLETAVAALLRESKQPEYPPCLRWIEHVSHRSIEAAEQMWEKLNRFSRSRGAAFVDDLSERLDRKLSEWLTTTELQTDKAMSILANSGKRFSYTRSSLIASMLRQGWDRSGLEPLIVFESIGELYGLFVAIRGHALPDWCVPVLYRYYLELLQHPSLVKKAQDMQPATMLIFSPIWTTAERQEVGELLVTALTMLEETAINDSKKAHYRGLKLLAAAIDTAAATRMGVAATEKDSPLPLMIAEVATVDPKQAWKLLCTIPNPDIRNKQAAAFVAPGLRVDVPWTIETLIPFVNTENAENFLREVLTYTNPEQWPTVSVLAWKAVENIPAREAHHLPDEHIAILIRHAPEIGAALLFKDPAAPLRWVDFLHGCRDESHCAELFDRLLPFSADRLVDSITALGDTIKYDKSDFRQGFEWILDILIAICATEMSSMQETVVESLYQTLLNMVKERNSPDLTGDILEILAERAPDRTLTWLDSLDYKGDSLYDVLTTILTKAPEHFELISRTWLQSIEGFEGSRVMCKALAHQTLDTAFAHITKHDIDTDDFVYEWLKAQQTDTKSFDQLMSMLKTDTYSKNIAAKRFECLCLALSNPLNSEPAVRNTWLAQSIDALRSGRFVHFKNDIMEFELAGETFFIGDKNPLSVLYGAAPKQVEELFRRMAMDVSPENTVKLAKTLNEIREYSIPHLFRWSTDWVFEHLSELTSQPWWTNTYASVDDISDVLDKIPAHKAVQLVGVFESGDGLKNELDRALQKVASAEEMQQTVMILINDMLQQHADQAPEILELCLKHGERLGLPVLDMMLDWMGQLQTVEHLLNLKHQDWPEVMAAMCDIAAGKDCDAGHIFTTPETPVQAELKAEISEKKKWIQRLIDMKAPPEAISVLRDQAAQMEEALAALSEDM